MAEPTSERIEGPTPGGGHYAIVFYQDIDGAPVPKDEALRAEAIEYSANGKEIAFTILDLTGADGADDDD